MSVVDDGEGGEYLSGREVLSAMDVGPTQQAVDGARWRRKRRTMTIDTDPFNIQCHRSFDPGCTYKYEGCAVMTSRARTFR